MIAIVEDKKAETADLCERYGVERLDLDFVVSFERRDPPGLFDWYFGLAEDLKDLLGRGVDLVTEDSLKKDPKFAEGISGAHVPLYAA